jgi:peroxiredoxin Q/BCP
MPIAAGQLAPDFTLPTDTGDTLTLSSLRGQWVVLYASASARIR